MQTLIPNNPANWYRLFLIACLIALSFILFSCSCNWHLAQIDKKCGSHSTKDTILLIDTLIVKEVKHDTTFKHTNRIDTLTLIKDRLTVKYFYNTHDSTVYLQGVCASDTIIKYIKVPYESTIYEFDYWAKYKWYIIISLIIFFFILFTYKYLKN